MNNDLIDFVDGLQRANSTEDLYDLSRDYFMDLGFRYLNVALIDTLTFESLGMFSNMSADWLSHYTASGYAGVDPYVAFGVDLEGAAVLPHAHFMQGIEEQPKLVECLLRESEAEGLRSSYLHAQSSRGSRIKTGLNLILDEDFGSLEQLLQSKRTEVVVGSALVQLAFMDRARDDFKGASYFSTRKAKHVLTPRETEIVRLLIGGLRNDRIADQLRISSATVNFHIVSAKRKLSAKTREQLVAIAILRGLVDL